MPRFFFRLLNAFTSFLSIIIAYCSQYVKSFFKKVQKIIPGEEAGDLLYSEEPEGRHAEDASKDGYLIIGNKPRSDFDTAYRVPLHYSYLYYYSTLRDGMQGQKIERKARFYGLVWNINKPTIDELSSEGIT